MDLKYDYGWNVKSYLSYNYSKIDMATAYRERIQPPKQIISLKRSFLTCANLGDGKDIISRLDFFF